jgi:hypothetical protein
MMDDDYYDNQAETHPVPTTPAFVLAPLNNAARKAVDHARNNHLRFRVDDTIGLWLDFSNPDKQVCTLGCEGTDIFLPDARSSSKGSADISPLHASFQVVEDTGAVLLWDLSDNHTVEPLPHNHCYTVRFRPNAKSVLVAKGINSRIAFGRDQWFQFEIHWQSDGLYRFPKHEPYTMGPRSSRTKRYLVGGEVGAGSYGTVLWALDATNGKIIAVKKFHKLQGKNLEFATREIANLFRINKDDSIKHVSGFLFRLVKFANLNILIGTHSPDPRQRRRREGRRVGRDFHAPDERQSQDPYRGRGRAGRVRVVQRGPAPDAPGIRVHRCA